jgi:hypothetical protein
LFLLDRASASDPAPLDRHLGYREGNDFGTIFEINGQHTLHLNSSFEYQFE